jgi:ferritin
MKTRDRIVKFSLFENIENEGRLPNKVVDLLNKQIKSELQASQIYRGMSCWLDSAGWNDASKYYFKAAQEELIHMDKIYQYLFDRNVVAKVPVTDEVKQVFDSIEEVLRESLKHEMLVSTEWEEISRISKEEDDSTTFQFAQWFLVEQVEEENKFRDILDKVNLDIPKWKIDELFK